MLKKILIILFIWVICFTYQYVTKSGAAYMLVQQKIEELDALDFDVLLQKAEKGYEYKEAEINGKRYWMRWIIRRPVSLVDDKNINTVEIRGSVDFIELLPFLPFRIGSRFKLIINRN